jgi:hypothetical protein
VSHTLRTRRLSLRCTPNSPRDREDPLLRYWRQVPLQIRSLTRLTLARRPSHHVPAPEHRQSILQRAAAQSSTCRPLYTQSPPTNRTFRQSDGLLGQAAFKITVAPASKVFDITYYDYHRVSVLLTGSRVLIAYPSLHFLPLPLAQSILPPSRHPDWRYLQQHIHIFPARHCHCAKRWRNTDHPAFLVLPRILHIDVHSS